MAALSRLTPAAPQSIDPALLFAHTEARSLGGSVAAGCCALLCLTATAARSWQVFCSDSSGARDMAAAWSVPHLGTIPMDPELTRAAEAGQSLPLEALASPAIAAIVARIIAQCTAENDT